MKFALTFLSIILIISMITKYRFGRPATDGNLIHETCVRYKDNKFPLHKPLKFSSGWTYIMIHVNYLYKNWHNAQCIKKNVIKFKIYLSSEFWEYLKVYVNFKLGFLGKLSKSSHILYLSLSSNFAVFYKIKRFKHFSAPLFV